jgi:streptomycin 6-kinase
MAPGTELADSHQVAVPSSVPELGDELRRRLGRRFGTPIESWLDGLQPVLTALAERWEVILDSVIERGSMSVVLRCRTADGSPTLLKISPDRKRAAEEAAALTSWTTVHVPRVLAVDEVAGALLIEAIQPGTALDESAIFPDIEAVASLMAALHQDQQPRPGGFRPVSERISHLFESGKKNYERRPDLAAVVPPALYEQGHRSAMRLATESPETVLLHGDLTPSNILDGGAVRGLVAIDPAPCWGDPAFDAVDLLFWQAEDRASLDDRTRRLALETGLPYERLHEWCSAFAAMVALEIAEACDIVPDRVHMLVGLALTGTSGLPR